MQNSITQKKEKPDAIYNGWLITLTALLIAIYHPIFATFQKKMTTPLNDFKFNSDDLCQVHKFVINSLAFYQNVDFYKKNLNDFWLVHDDILKSTILRNRYSFTPDGNTWTSCKLSKGPALCAVTSFTKVRNGIGEGGSNPIHQVQCDYVAYYSAEVVGLFFFLSCFSESQTYPFLVLASLRCMLLSLIPYWYFWPFHDHLWCCSCWPFHFSELDGLYLSWWKATSWRATLWDHQGSDDFERMHRWTGAILFGPPSCADSV